jgi:hypothetical protein
LLFLLNTITAVSNNGDNGKEDVVVVIVVIVVFFFTTCTRHFFHPNLRSMQCIVCGFVAFGHVRLVVPPRIKCQVVGQFNTPSIVRIGKGRLCVVPS